jgi:catechol 2,3-dioxygenase-like lactoylglutathione lyase family enzyme
MRAMIDHIMVRVKDYQVSRDFYDQVLATLGYQRLMEFGNGAGYGSGGKPYFWIGQEGEPHPRIHIAFAAKDRAAVDAFHDLALKLGAKSDGAPGVREQYHPNYYGAFVLDPDGHNIEAVCHLPEKASAKAKQGAVKAKGAAKQAAAKAKGAVGKVAAKAKAIAKKPAARAKKPAPRRR